MDSKTDYPIISTEEYAKAVAYATMEAVAAVSGLQKKRDESDVRYRVQVGYFSKKDNAERLQAQLKGLGFGAIIKEEHKVVGAS